jgi:hypothetical protein
MPDNQNKRFNNKSNARLTNELTAHRWQHRFSVLPVASTPGNGSHASVDTFGVMIPSSEFSTGVVNPSHWIKRKSQRVIAHSASGEPIHASYLRHTNSTTGASAVLLPQYPCAPPGVDYLIVIFSLARLTHGVNYGPVSAAQARQGFVDIQQWLSEIGISNADLHRAQLCRLAPNFNLVLNKPVSYGLGMVAQTNLPYMRRRLYYNDGQLETVLFRNGQKSLQLYDKIREMLARGHDVSHLPPHVLRAEYSAKNAAQCRKFFGSEKVTGEDFLNRFDEIPVLLQAALSPLQPDHEWLHKRQKDAETAQNVEVLALIKREIKDTISRWHKKRKALGLVSAVLFKKWSEGSDHKSRVRALKLALSKHPDIAENSADLLRRIEKILRHHQLNADAAGNPAFVKDYLAFFRQITAPDFLSAIGKESGEAHSPRKRSTRRRCMTLSRWPRRFRAHSFQKSYRAPRRRNRRRRRLKKP